MQGIIILAHGSRRIETKVTMDNLITSLKDKQPTLNIKAAYMELCHPELDEVVLELVNEDVDDVKIIPYFLFEGIHIKKDIPELINNLKTNHPNIKITLGNVLGEDIRLVDIINERIKEML